MRKAKANRRRSERKAKLARALPSEEEGDKAKTKAKPRMKFKVCMGRCSEPNRAADDIYKRLKYKKTPYRKNQNREEFVIYSATKENRKVLGSRKNG